MQASCPQQCDVQFSVHHTVQQASVAMWRVRLEKYFTISTVHGIKYIMEPKRQRSERFAVSKFKLQVTHNNQSFQSVLDSLTDYLVHFNIDLNQKPSRKFKQQADCHATRRELGAGHGYLFSVVHVLRENYCRLRRGVFWLRLLQNKVEVVESRVNF